MSHQSFNFSFRSLQFILKWLGLSAVTGICTGAASAGFLWSLQWATNYRESHQWMIALLPVAGLLIGLLYYYYGKTVEAGNNLLIDTIHNPGNIVPFRMAPFVYAGTIVTHLFGGSAGREGTALQMAGAIADQFSRPFRLNAADRKILIIAAIAGGFGSVFGTPFAGSVFALEVFLIGNLRYNALFPAFATAVIANMTAHFLQAPHTHYTVITVPAMAPLQFISIIIAGLLFGLCARAFSTIMETVSGWFKKFIAYPPLRPLAGGIIIAAAVWLAGTTKYIGLGIPGILEAFDHTQPAYVFALKMAFTILTLAAGFKGGEVTPLFFIGATLGSALAFVLPLPTALLAGAGFVAVFAGATNTPLACSIMAMELFGAECGMYAAIACIVAYYISGHNSIYKTQVIGTAKGAHLINEEKKRMSEL